MIQIRKALPAIILTMILLAQISSSVRADTKKIDGFGIGSGTHLRVGTAGLSSALDEQQWMGVHWSREDLPWSEVEYPIGQMRTELPFGEAYWDFNLLLSESAQRDIQVVFILDYQPYYLRDQPFSPDVFLAAWERYVKLAVDTFGDKVDAWEIENEMNSRMFWGKVVRSDGGNAEPDPAFYARMLQAAYKIIKQKDPGDVVVLGGLVTITDSDCATNPYVYLGGLYNLGAWDSFDVISFHPYWSANNPEAFIPRGKAHSPDTGACLDSVATRNLIGETRELRDLANKLGAKPIWITEIGWSNDWLVQRPSERGTTTDVVEADYLVRTYVPLLSEEGMDKLFWYTQVEPLNSAENFTLGSNGKQAFRNLSLLLNGGKALGQVQGQNDRGGAADDDVYEYRFSNSGKTIVVAWKARGGDVVRNVALQDISASTVRVYLCDAEDISDTAGIELAVNSNSIQVDLTEHSVLIVFEDANLLEKAWNDFVESVQKWWDEQSESVQRQIKEWWNEQSKKLADQFDQWWADFQKQLQAWFEQQLANWINQLCGGSAFILPSLALTLFISRRSVKRKR